MDKESTPTDLTSTAATEATLTVDLGAVRENYLKLKTLCGPAECGAAVKGNAYGTGIRKVVRALSRAGCKTFFVAQLEEAEAVRDALPDPDIYVLNGLSGGTAPQCAERRLRPVLGSLEEIAEWHHFCRDYGEKLPGAVHVDTGINRLGLSRQDVETVAGSRDLHSGFEWSLVMSHLALADEPNHPMNREQVERFDELRARLPEAPASLSNSAGTLNGPSYHYDVVRPGIALYGGNPFATLANPMQRVVRLESTVLQVRQVDEGDTVGYGATWRAKRPSRIAIVPVGYADGYFRWLFDRRGDGTAGVCIDGRFAPLAGRVSMDMVTVDVTDIASDKVRRGTTVELLGPNITVDDVARWAGTIPYEVLTALGARYHRVYRDRPSRP